MEESQEDIVVSTNTDKFVLKGRPCEFSAFAYVPPMRNDPPERTVYNSEKKKNTIHTQHLTECFIKTMILTTNCIDVTESLVLLSRK